MSRRHAHADVKTIGPHTDFHFTFFYLSSFSFFPSLSLSHLCRVAGSHTNVELQGNLLQDYEHKFEHLTEDQKLSKLCYDVGLKIVERGEIFITLAEEEGPVAMKNLCREYTLPRSEEASPSERVDPWKHEGRSSLGCKGLPSSRTLRFRNSGRISVPRQKKLLGS